MEAFQGVLRTWELQLEMCTGWVDPRVVSGGVKIFVNYYGSGRVEMDRIVY